MFVLEFETFSRLLFTIQNIIYKTYLLSSRLPPSVLFTSNYSLMTADETNINLAKPEFEGLWDKHKPYKVPKDEGGIRLPGATKMEKV